MTDPTSTPDAERARRAARRVRARRARRRRPRARRRVPRTRTPTPAPRSTRCARPRRRWRSLPDTPIGAPPGAVAAHRAGDRRRDAHRRVDRERAAGRRRDPIDELAARRDRTRADVAGVAPVAAAAIAIVLLVAQVVSLHDQLDTAHQARARRRWPPRSTGPRTRPARREVGLQSGSGATLARVVLLPDGTGYLRGDHLAPLPANKTYQLWAVTGSARRRRRSSRPACSARIRRRSPSTRAARSTASR